MLPKILPINVKNFPLTSIPNPFKMLETVDKAFQTLPCRNIGVVPGIAFSAIKFYYSLYCKGKNKNSNYYNPYSHTKRLLDQQ